MQMGSDIATTQPPPSALSATSAVNRLSPVQEAYLIGLRDALHIARQETTKSDILAGIQRRVAECEGAEGTRHTAQGNEGAA
jgi:hypothetical protein